MSIDMIFEKLENIVLNPSEEIKKYKYIEDRKIIGCFPVYCPEEIIHASGMLPVGLWGGNTELELSKQYFPAFACSIMQSCMEYALKGTYDELSAVIIPGMCDTLICAGQNWKSAIPHIRYISLVHPQNRKIQAGIEYLKDEYLNIAEILEKISGNSITKEKLNNSIGIYNEHRRTLREFVDLANNYPQIITPYKRHIAIKSGYFMDKKDHSIEIRNIINELAVVKPEKAEYKKVLLSGIVADSKELLKALEMNNIQVVSDDLAQESRQFRYDIPDGDDPFYRLAEYWSIFEGCSLAYDPEKKRGNIIIDEIQQKEIDGVIFCMMKFCDPEEYDYPFMKKAVDSIGIPNLYIEIDQQSKVDEQIATRLQTFSEILNNQVRRTV